MTGNSINKTPSMIGFSWLLLLRWGAVACQVLLILAVYLLFDIRIPFLILAAIITFEGISNLYFYYLTKQKTIIPDRLFGLVMFLDIVLLTVLLYYTGGPMNPFTFLYLVHVALGAILMRPKWSWSLAAITVFCYASVFFLPVHGISHESSLISSTQGQPLCIDAAKFSSIEEQMRLHLYGMWVAFSVTAFFIVFFVGKIQKSLEEQQETLAELEEEKIRTEKLGSLATLAAGAAHEFSTPLSTIAVAAGEMAHFLRKNKGPEELVEDVKLIKEQIDRCKEILYQMSADAGGHLGEAVEDFTLERLMDGVSTCFPAADLSPIKFVNEAGSLSFRMPFRTIKRLLCVLIKNGIDASSKEMPVIVVCRRDAQFVYFDVKDSGTGMNSEILSKATEPFFTTKDPGKGLGLGLFLAKSAAERFGGSLEIKSDLGKGTEVTLSLALAQVVRDGFERTGNYSGNV